MGRADLLILLAGLSLVACDRGSPYGDIRNLKAPGENVVCFGDSLTEGIGASSGEDYPSVLGRRLGRPVVNAGKRGDTSAEGLRRLESDVLAHDPRLVIVLFGGNDFLRQIPVGETKQNMDSMVRRIQERGAMVVLAGMRLGLFTDEYGPVFREIADRNGALLIPDILDGMLSDSRLTSDPIHPNGAGYRLLAERVLEKVKPLLEEADRRR